MIRHQYWGAILAGIGAGIVTGLFGTGGGMVLVPLLGLLTSAKEEEIFPCSICVTLPLCIVTLISTPGVHLEMSQILPYLLGSAAGGLAAGILGTKIPVLWLHRILGAFVLWGGIRYLC